MLFHSPRCVTMLCKNGASTSISGQSGLTTAHIAAACGQLSCLKALHVEEAKLFAKDIHGGVTLFFLHGVLLCQFVPSDEGIVISCRFHSITYGGTVWECGGCSVAANLGAK